MSLNAPSRRLIQAARPVVRQSPFLTLKYLLPYSQRRHAWFDFLRRKDKRESDAAGNPGLTPFVDEHTRQKSRESLIARSAKRQSEASIFDEEVTSSAAEKGGDDGGMPVFSNAWEHKARALDPDPRSRVRWQRKKVIQMVKANGFVSKEERIKRVEKDIINKSDWLPTSTKKIGFLARQIVGKSVNEAIVQMRYSKKKMAREVKYQLEEARDLAVVSRGMGLGQVSGEEYQKGQEKRIRTKDGKWMVIKDPTQLYVDQAWVNRGPWRGYRFNHHGRGNRSMMKKPSTSITVVLKEEKTRIRQHEEREAKQQKKAPWVHLANRPVTGQRQYYSW